MDMQEQKNLKKDNKIVLAKYTLTGLENKIYNYVLRELQIKTSIARNKYQESGLAEELIESKIRNEIVTCEISRYEINKLTNAKQQQELIYQKNLLDGLKNKTLIFQDYDENGLEKWISANFFSSVGYNEKNSIFYIRIDPLIYLAIIKSFDNGNFTLLDLNNLFKLKSYYSQRLYELLKKWRFKSCHYKIEDLKEYMLGCNYKKTYTQTAEFKRRILEPSIKELIEKNLYDESLTFSQKKIGNKVSEIIFENVIDKTLNIKINEKDILKLNKIKDKFKLANNNNIVEVKDVTIKLLENLIDISYSTRMKYLVFRADLIGTELYIATLNFKSDIFIDNKLGYILDVIKNIFSVKKVYLNKIHERKSEKDLIDINEYYLVCEDNETIEYEEDIEVEEDTEVEEDIEILENEIIQMIKTYLVTQVNKITFEEQYKPIEKIIVHKSEKKVEIYSSFEKKLDDFETDIIIDALYRFDIINDTKFKLNKIVI